MMGITILECIQTIQYPLNPHPMPVRNRTYERVLQCIFGAVIVLVLLQALYNIIEKVWKHLF